MKTTVYISRHSQPFRKLLGEYNANEIEQIRNEKNILSVEGEEKAKKLCEIPELKNVEIIYSSHYVRAMSTAKYIAEMNNIELNIDENFGERKFGVSNMNELPKDFFERQWKDINFKINDGESINEVQKRMATAFYDVINNNRGKTIMIVSHVTSLTAMLKEWCDVKLKNNSKQVNIYFNNNLVFDGNWNCPEVFKLEFDENNNLLNFENLKIT